MAWPTVSSTDQTRSGDRVRNGMVIGGLSVTGISIVMDPYITRWMEYQTQSYGISFANPQEWKSATIQILVILLTGVWGTLHMMMIRTADRLAEKQASREADRHEGDPPSVSVTGRILLLACASCLWASTLWAQPIVNPGSIAFDPSLDHARLVNGVPVLDTYTLQIGPGSQPDQIVRSTVIGKPDPNAAGEIEFALRNDLMQLPSGIYVASIRATGPGGWNRSILSDPFEVDFEALHGGVPPIDPPTQTVPAPAAPPGKPRIRSAGPSAMPVR